MSESAETYDDSGSEVMDSKLEPRKRSKVSRACDACRRKKIRCDAQFSQTSNQLTQTCTSCSKSGEQCTFRRVPLKRGPSKGYIRDLEEKAEMGKPFAPVILPPINSFGGYAQSLHVQGGAPFVGPPGILLFNGPPMAATMAPATSLPLAIPHRLSEGVSSGGGDYSPRNSFMGVAALLLPGERKPEEAFRVSLGPDVPTGLFWKVPYEMPLRRGSIESVSSVGSRFSPHPGFYDSPVESEDEYSRRYSSGGSPRTSIRGGSLTGIPSHYSSHRLSVSSGAGSLAPFQSSATISPAPHSPAQPPSPSVVPPLLTSTTGIHTGRTPALPQSSSLVPMSGPISPSLGKAPQPLPLETSRPVPETDLLPLELTLSPTQIPALTAYFSLFHKTFPILPLQSFPMLLSSIVLNTQTQPFIDLLQVSLGLLVSHQTLSLLDLHPALLRHLELLPSLPSDERFVLLHLCSGVLLNYAALLSGIPFASGLGVVFAAFHQLGVHQLQPLKDSNPDSFPLVASRLYFSLQAIDTISACQFHLPLASSRSCAGTTVHELIPIYTDSMGTLNVYQAVVVLAAYQKGPLVWSVYSLEKITGLPGLFLTLLRNKCELFAFLKELPGTESDDESIQDYQLKLCRLCRKTTLCIANLLNFVSSLVQSNQLDLLVSPLLPLVMAQTAKLVLMVERVVEGLGYNRDLVARLGKLRSELSVNRDLLGVLRVPLNERAWRERPRESKQNGGAFEGGERDWRRSVAEIAASD